MVRNILNFVVLTLNSLAEIGVSSQTLEIGEKGALAGDRYRILISTDIGGSDPDDFQSMIHFLALAHGHTKSKVPRIGWMAKRVTMSVLQKRRLVIVLMKSSI